MGSGFCPCMGTVRPPNEAAKLTYNLVNVWVSAGDIWRFPKIGVPLRP